MERKHDTKILQICLQKVSMDINILHTSAYTHNNEVTRVEMSLIIIWYEKAQLHPIVFHQASLISKVAAQDTEACPNTFVKFRWLIAHIDRNLA